jgi:phosphoribosylformylglycinamidine synthase
MDLKAPDNLLVLIGETLAELGGSHLLRVLMQLDPRRFGDATSRGQVPGLSQQAKDIHAALHRAIEAGLVRSAHDLSEGGLAVAAAEMAFSGEVGAEIELSRVAAPDDVKDDLTLLFSESNTRYLLEVQDDDLPALLACFRGLPAAVVGRTVAHPILRVIGRDGEPHGKPHRKTVLAEALKDLKEAWQGTLRL